MRWTTPPFARSNSLRDASGKTSMTFWEQVVVNPRFWLSAGAHVSVAAVLSLLALWAALDARDRLARALVAWVAVMLLVAIRVHGPALVFALISAWTIVLISFARHLGRECAEGESRWKGWYRFALSDLCLLILLIATLLGLQIRQPPSPWAIPVALVVALVPALIICLSYFAVVGHHRLTVSMVLAAVLIATPGGPLWNIPFLPHWLRWRQSIGAFESPLHGLLLGLIVLLIYFTVLLAIAAWGSFRSVPPTRQQSFVRFGLAATVTLLAVASAYFYDAFLANWRHEGRQVLYTLYGAVPLAILSAIVMAATALARLSTKSTQMRRTIQTSAAIVVALIGLPLAWLYWQMLWLPSIQPFQPAGPTNYDRIAAIAKQLNDKLPVTSRIGVRQGELESLVAEASRLLAAPNHIPVHVVEMETRRPRPESVLSYQHVFAVEWALGNSAEAAEAAKEYEEAVERGLDLVRLGAMLHRGGTSGHCEMGDHAARRALPIVSEASPHLSREASLRAIRVIDEAIAQRENLAAVKRRDEAFQLRISPWTSRLAAGIVKIVPDRASFIGHRGDPHASSELSLRSLQLRLALDQFRKATGRPPLAMSELVPDYLPAELPDPFSYSQLPLCTRRGANQELIIYSIGPNRLDDGGNFGRRDPSNMFVPPFDLKLPFD